MSCRRPSGPPRYWTNSFTIALRVSYRSGRAVSTATAPPRHPSGATQTRHGASRRTRRSAARSRGPRMRPDGRPEHEQPGVALGDDLEQRAHRPPARDAQELGRDAERGGARRGRADLLERLLVRERRVLRRRRASRSPDTAAGAACSRRSAGRPPRARWRPPSPPRPGRSATWSVARTTGRAPVRAVAGGAAVRSRSLTSAMPSSSTADHTPRSVRSQSGPSGRKGTSSVDAASRHVVQTRRPGWANLFTVCPLDGRGREEEEKQWLLPRSRRDSSSRP